MHPTADTIVLKFLRWLGAAGDAGRYAAMDKTMKTPLRSQQIAYLLDELCVELGFCLPPDERARLQNKPPEDIDAFTDDVFRAEGLEPMADRQLRRQVRAKVAECFERPGAGAA